MLLIASITLAATAAATAIVCWLLLPNVRARGGGVMSAIVRDHAIRPSGPGGTWLRRDRLAGAAVTAAGAALLLAAAMGAFWLAELWPGGPVAMVVSGVGFVAFFLALTAAAVSVGHLVRAPFAARAAE